MECTLTYNESEFLISAMQQLSTRDEAFFQQQCDVDSSNLYQKLLDFMEQNLDD